jgi:short-subunit dehydrogenase
MMDLKNKTILLTGASSGIGKALAVRFAKENCKLILTARRTGLLQQLSKDISSNNGLINVFSCDVSVKEEVAALFEKLKADNLLPDIAVLNAGVAFRNEISDFDSSRAEKTFATNVMGIVYFVEQLLPIFKQKKAGTIVGVSSLADGRGFPKSGIYCASKAAATRYLESLRVELKPHSIKVLTVKPGFVKTEMTAKNEFRMAYLMEPEKAAEIIFNGIIKEKRTIQFPWQMVAITKLVRIIPDRMFDFIAAINPKTIGERQKF